MEYVRCEAAAAMSTAMKPFVSIMLAAVLAATQAGCDSGRSGDDSAARPMLSAFNAVPDLGSITFLREEQVWAHLEYGGATEFRSVDADQYDVNFDTVLPGDETSACAGRDSNDVKADDECTRLTSTSINVIGDHEYVVALLGRYGSLRVQVYDKLVHEFDNEDKTTEVQFFHWSDDLPELDVYLERPGANLSPVQSRATLTSGAEFHGIIDDGSYVITLAPVGDPANPLYTSETFALQKQSRVAFAILSGAGDGTSTIKIARFRAQGGGLLDRRVGTELRLSHVARGGGAFDVYANEDFTQPFVASLAEGATSAYVTVPSVSLTDLELDVTPAGNPGVLLGREEVDLVRGERATFLLFGSVGRLDGLRLRDPFRRIATHALLRMINTASASVDFFVVRSGSNINTLSPTIQLATAGSSGLLQFEPEVYDILLTRAGTDEIVFGPRTVELAGGGIYTVIATGDATAANAVLLDDFQN